MSRITADEVRELASLARLRLTEPEVARMTGELDAMLDYVAALRELDTDDVQPMTHAVPFVCPLRSDEVRESLPVDEALANAPRREGPFFQVPRIVPGPGGAGSGGAGSGGAGPGGAGSGGGGGPGGPGPDGSAPGGSEDVEP